MTAGFFFFKKIIYYLCLIVALERYSEKYKKLSCYYIKVGDIVFK